MSKTKSTLLSEKEPIDALKRMVFLAEEFLQNVDQDIDYQKVANDFLEITQAKYVVFNLFDEIERVYHTKGIAGDIKNIQKASKWFGFNLFNFKWREDPSRTEKLREKTITYFDSLKDITSERANVKIMRLIERFFHVGEVIVIKIMKQDTLFGDFMIFMDKSQSFEHEVQAELYTRQMGLVLSQKRTQDELNSSRQQLSDIIDHSPDATFVVDTNKKVLVWNKAMEEMTKLKAEDVLGKSEEVYMIPFYGDIRPHLFDLLFSIKTEKDMLYHKFTKRNNTYAIENFCIGLHEGKGAWISATASALHDNQGKIIGAIETIRDITAIKLTEQELIENELRIQTITSAAQDAIIMLNHEGKINFWNDAAERIFGYKKDEILGKGLHKLIARPEKLALHEQTMPLFGQSGQADVMGKTLNLLASRKNKTLINIQVSLSSVQLKDGWNAIGIVRDVTEEKKLEHALIDSENSLLAAQEIAHYGNWTLDLSTKEITASKEAFKIYGIPYDGANTKMTRTRESVLPEYRSKLDQALSDLLSDDIPYDIEFELINPLSNQKRIIHSKAVKVCDETGNAIKVAGTIQDITESKAIERILTESEEKYRSLYSAMDQGLAFHELIFDELGNPIDYVYLDINDSYTRLLGIKKEDCIGKRVTEIFPDVEPYWIEQFGKVALTGQSSYYENYLQATNRYYSTYSYSIKKNQFAVLVTDITDRKRSEENIMYLSYHDHLTGLYNRRFFEEELKRLDVERNLPMTIVMGDVNGLKIINDSFGHDFGDELLVKAVGAIKKGCRDDEIIARLGGDEFAILLLKTSETDAEKVIKRIHENIAQEKIGNMELSISFGYSTKTSMDEITSEVFKSAENHMYRHKLSDRQSARNNTISLILNTLFEKNKREAVHSQRVSNLCHDIAQACGFTKEDVEQITTTGLIHDIGKIGIPESILDSTNKLSDDEYHIIKEHPEVGYRILSSSLEFNEIAQDVMQHHERWDGKGYPQGLAGEKITLNARIICIADAYDAMISERPYRNKLSKKEAIEELKRCSGTQFDPSIVKIFIERVLSSKKPSANTL